MATGTSVSPGRSRGGGPASYLALREYHKRAYDFLSVALEIDESGKGEPTDAIDYYSRGVAALEEGIACDVYEVGEDQEKAEKLKERMISNLEMARDRVNVLLQGGALKGVSLEAKRPHLQPTASLRVHKITPPREPTNKKKPAKNPVMGKPRVSHIKGIDHQLADKILDEIVDQGELTVTWDDVVGLELPKRTLQEIVILPALRPELFTGLRSPARGMLLFGPPGNGKTMLAKAVAHESQAKFFNISAASLTSKWVGDGEKLVKTMFALARELQPSIIFLDEVDALLSKRGGSEHDAMRRIKNEFLQSFDGMHTQEGERILVMAATNRPQELDDAALRRFEKRIYIPLPGKEARKSVLRKLISKHHNLLSEDQLNKLASMTDGYSGSDLTALAKDASLGPIRELDFNALKSVPANQVRPIGLNDFQLSMRTIRPSVAKDLITTLEQWNTLYGVSS
ncbi:spastin-like isoform X2 [Halichondria panicea]|uniref:spastin-like isoform X2 n=1 Tax=Halichondria panicea TaxID=6063 RepID=UPI00312B9892